MRVLAYVGALVVTAGGTGCSVATTTTVPSPPARTMIVVQNQSGLDVEVYMWDSWNRATRIGFVASRDTADFDVPETVLAAAGPYSLEARPTIGGEYPTNSEAFSLKVGFRITWAIPPSEAMGAAANDAPPGDTLAGPAGAATGP